MLLKMHGSFGAAPARCACSHAGGESQDLMTTSCCQGDWEAKPPGRVLQHMAQALMSMPRDRRRETGSWSYLGGGAARGISSGGGSGSGSSPRKLPPAPSSRRDSSPEAPMPARKRDSSGSDDAGDAEGAADAAASFRSCPGDFMLLQWTGRPPSAASPTAAASGVDARQPAGSGSHSASRAPSLQQELSLLPASTRRLPSDE